LGSYDQCTVGNPSRSTPPIAPKWDEVLQFPAPRLEFRIFRELPDTVIDPPIRDGRKLHRSTVRARLERWLDLLRSGFWFVPLLMLLAATALALVLLHVDTLVDPGMKASLVWAYSGGPDGARSLLSTIAGSMITAASVTFSLASVALSIASQQYGSRVLRSFMRDRITQVLLGIFVSTFVYSVLVVRAIRGSDISGGFVPAISVTVSIALSLTSLVLLIFFIHHISASIQASRIVRVIANEMADAIAKPDKRKDRKPREERSHRDWMGDRNASAVAIAEDGYLQTIDLDALFDMATRSDTVIEIVVKPGDHLVSGQEVARVRGDFSQDHLKRAVESFLLGGERTPTQDIRYHFQQLTDVIIRALSPGINDPYTAINGIDELTSSLPRLAECAAPEEWHDNQGTLRMIVPKVRISEILDETVGHIAIYATRDRFVMNRLDILLDVVEPRLQKGEDLETLLRLRKEVKPARQARSIVHG